jgi:uncharacterized protein (UPF0261 family)
VAKTIALAGTFDSKGEEFLYVKNLIESLGFGTFTIHSGVFNPLFQPDVSNAEVAAAAGEDIKKLAVNRDRERATYALSMGMKILLPQLYAKGKFDGILSLGGSGGTSMVTAGMRALPFGVPKIVVSTMASGNTAPYVGISDIIMIPSIVDVAGLNRISTNVFARAVFAIVGMLEHENHQQVKKRPLIAATMFGLTTPCVNYAKTYLEQKGYEVLVFHATGTGGRTMEHLIRNGLIHGVLDLTTTEWADELVGGVLAAGPHRLEAAASLQVPQVVSLGALDMVNFGPFASVPEPFKSRRLYKHNPTVTLMRTTVDENKKMGEILAQKLNRSAAHTAALMIPLKGLSGIDAEGQPFFGPEEDRALFNTLKEKIDQNKVDLIEVNGHINEKQFAEAAAKKLLELMGKNVPGSLDDKKESKC